MATDYQALFHFDAFLITVLAAKSPASQSSITGAVKAPATKCFLYSVGGKATQSTASQRAALIEAAAACIDQTQSAGGKPVQTHLLHLSLSCLSVMFATFFPRVLLGAFLLDSPRRNSLFFLSLLRVSRSIVHFIQSLCNIFTVKNVTLIE